MALKPYRDFAGVYDRLMSGRYVRSWWSVFKRLTTERRWSYRTVADLAGGTGEAARYFSRRGLPVTVVDRSPAMLDRARVRVPGVRLLRQDLRRLRLPEPVDLAVCVYGGINYLPSLPEVEKFFRRVAVSLRPGGMFCVDAVTPYYLRSYYGGGTEVLESSGVFSLWRHEWDPVRRASRIRVDGFERVGKTWIRHQPEAHVHYAHPLSGLRRALRRAGFTSVEAFGLPHGEPAGPRDSHWLLLGRKGS